MYSFFLGRTVHVQQRFSAKFVDASVFAAAGASRLAQAQFDKSGNPGYVNGLPLAAGLLTNSSSVPVIQKLRHGLSLPRMASSNGMCRVCPTGVDANKWDCPEIIGFEDPGGIDRIPVLFNQDISVGCRIKLNRPQMESFCKYSTRHPLLLLPDSLRLGIWGDSDSGNVAEWIPNAQNQQQLADTSINPSSGQAWDPRGNCTGVVDAMHLQVLTASVGNVKNPQQKIIGARIRFGSVSWLAPQQGNDAYYTLTSTVSFLELPDGGSVEVMPAIPSVLPVLPDDLFYPFATGPAARAHPHTWLLYLISLLAALTLTSDFRV